MVSGENVFLLWFSGSWISGSTYPKLLTDVFPSGPDRVDAGDHLSGTVYLLRSDVLYTYSVNTAHSYTFIRSTSFTENTPDNPFSAGSSSSADFGASTELLPHAPRNVDAMWFASGGGEVVGVAVRHWVYSYNVSSQEWRYEGIVQC